MLAIPSPSLKPSQAARRLKGWNLKRKIGASVAAALALATLMAGVPVFWALVACAAAFAAVNRFGDQSQVVKAYRSKKDAATAEWNRVSAEWQKRASSQAFDAKRSELGRLKHELEELPKVRLRKLGELKANQRQLQMEEFLDQFEIDRATIPNIGPGRKQTLASYNIETAADLTAKRLRQVPGFGPVLSGKLLDWRLSIEARFKFDPTRPIDQRHISKVEQDILSEKMRIEHELSSGPAELRTISNQILGARQHMRPHVEAAYVRHLQATVDFEAVKN